MWHEIFHCTPGQPNLGVRRASALPEGTRHPEPLRMCEEGEPFPGAFLSWPWNLEAKLRCFTSTPGHSPGRTVVLVTFAENSSYLATAFPVAWRL